MAKLRVGVLMGGDSCEREVSLMSGKEIIKNLDTKKYEVVEIVIPQDLAKVKEVDMAFLALHGKGGEDGVIQGYLETLGIKYTGCGVLASAIGMNKKFFKWVMEHNNILMPKTVSKAPCVVKPNCGGSSVGVSIVENENELSDAIELAKKYDSEIIIEEYIEGIEVSCGILGNEVLPVIEIVSKKDFFDYEAKYTEGMSEEICPARLSEEVSKKVQELTMRVFEMIGGKGYARVDFIIKDKRAFLLEINTLPGMTPNSLLPKEAKAAGYSFSQMLDRIIESALL